MKARLSFDEDGSLDTELTDVWTLETPQEEIGAHLLGMICDDAIEGDTGAQDYLRGLWGGESWESIEKKLSYEDSTWYVWWMDGVRAFCHDTQE